MTKNLNEVTPGEETSGPKGFTRRNFIKIAAAVGAGLALKNTENAFGSEPTTNTEATENMDEQEYWIDVGRVIEARVSSEGGSFPVSIKKWKTDAEGAPLENIAVSAVFSSGEEIIEHTDSSGAVSFPIPVCYEEVSEPVVVSLCDSPKVKSESIIAYSSCYYQNESVEQPRRGDIIIFGKPELPQMTPGNKVQKYLAYFQELAREEKIYLPFFKEDLLTWDGTESPMSVPSYWGHIEVIMEDGGQKSIENWGKDRSSVVLRLKSQLGLDPEDIAKGFEDLQKNNIGLNQPFLAAFIIWIKRIIGDESVDWIKNPATVEMWKKIYGIDFNEVPNPEKLHDYSTTDIGDWAEFTKRTLSCSSMTFWSILHAYFKQNNVVQDWFLDRPDVVASIDALAPGQIPAYLIKKGYADVIAKSAILPSEAIANARKLGRQGVEDIMIGL